jgi:hypothetical protein
VALQPVGGGDPVGATLLDLGTGGFRCRVDPGIRVDPGAEMTADLALRGAPVRVRAAVVHVRPADRGATEAGLRFVDPDPDSAARIAQHVAVLLDGVAGPD